MQSNVYIARGARGGTAVMKVGKTNNIRQRQSELDITIEMSISQPDEAGALDLEAQLRLFILSRGGKKLPRTTDWFYFDSDIYIALYATVAKLKGEPFNDIALILLKPLIQYEAARDEALSQRDVALVQVDLWKWQVERLKEELAAEKAVSTQWQIRYDALKENLEAKGGG